MIIVEIKEDELNLSKALESTGNTTVYAFVHDKNGKLIGEAYADHDDIWWFDTKGNKKSGMSYKRANELTWMIESINR